MWGCREAPFELGWRGYGRARCVVGIADRARRRAHAHLLRFHRNRSHTGCRPPCAIRCRSHVNAWKVCTGSSATSDGTATTSNQEPMSIASAIRLMTGSPAGLARLTMAPPAGVEARPWPYSKHPRREAAAAVGGGLRHSTREALCGDAGLTCELRRWAPGVDQLDHLLELRRIRRLRSEHTSDFPFRKGKGSAKAGRPQRWS